MSTNLKNQMKEVMSLAWSFVKRNGFSMSEALKCAWANMKLKAQMKNKIVKFYFQKVDGTMREAYGTLCEKYMPAVTGNDKRAMIQFKPISIQNAVSSDVSRRLTF